MPEKVVAIHATIELGVSDRGLQTAKALLLITHRWCQATLLSRDDDLGTALAIVDPMAAVGLDPLGF
jgi:hypothetical protein